MAVSKGSEKDESFQWPDVRLAFHAATTLGIKIRVQKLNGTGYRIWRVA
jgi:hypothetical protein